MVYPDTHGGAPGLGSTREVDYRKVFLANERFLPGSFVIDGANARDVNNTDRKWELRAGLLLGRITSSNKFGASVIGTLGALHDTSADGTTLTVPTAEAEEIERRIGSSGTLRLVGPATAGGTVNEEEATFTAVNTSNGEITLDGATTNDFIAGSFIQPSDGSEDPTTILYNGYPVRVIDADLDDRDVELGRYPIGGLIDASQILDWPSDSALQQWLIDELNAVGNFVFDSKHGL